MSLPVAIGDVIAEKYRVDRLLGSGGMGVVVAATHLELRTRRAIKVMQPHVVASALCIERFLREARALSELRSTHVARVYDVGRLPNDAPFMVMEYLEGQTLLSRLAEVGPLPVEEAAIHVLHACEALAEAHALGIVHRDLKPDNLFLTQAHDGSPCVKVLDFGVSKLLRDEGPTRTSTGAIVGSPLYMSPEQINAARDIDGRSDIWALGIILFQLVTGECPFGGSNVLQILSQLANKKPPVPSSLRKDLPPSLDAIILRCLEKDRERRYPDVVALARDLAPLARPDPEPPAALVARIERVHAQATKKAAMSIAAVPEVDASFALRADQTMDLGRTPPPWTRAGIQTTIPAEGGTLPSNLGAPTETHTAKPRRAMVRHFAAAAIVLTLSVPLGGFFYKMSPGAHTTASPVPAASSFLFPPLPATLPSTGLSASEQAPNEAKTVAPAAASVGVVPISSGSAPPSTTGRTVFPQNRSTPRPPPRY
ncbi:serine/threonine-protein kinase [Polyangium jinanense]|uniref:Protein kinase n=1 Tax=Polyangium jinanense TaxID=2829994 RepID=A0A9X3WV91_9BACT|nr:serine/threonine protein kinase [Polyangium jinanense]MDC3953904.1 protein kinase [Polyangium jinanense]MDC3957883.1 protein kinase [Polyangium jinanense]MDC3978969.1 protein kinase [Polyangium jinanense]MDC3982140.1 protein kinase [Polyangium jinanense]